MRNILVPVDGSENSLRAARHAVELARLVKPLTIHLAYAHEEPIVYGEIAVYVSREKMAALQREHAEAMLAPAERLVQESGVPYTSKILIGPIAQALVAHAEASGCDAIVMGTHGMSALGGLLMGSVATKVVHLTRLPVTLIK